MDFIAIEIDTANQWRDSICSIGLVKVVQSEVVDSLFTYINPNQPFDEYHTSKHGITKDLVQLSPTFKEFYPILDQWISNQTVIGYHEAFIQSVLEESCQSIGELVPYCTFGCILEFAKNQSPEQQHFSLRTLGHLFGIPLELEEAEIIAQLVLSFEKKYENFSLTSLTQKIQGTLTQASFSPNPSCFKNKIIVFTGGLEGLTRSTAAKKIRALGGIFSNTVTKRTNLLIVSNESWRKAQIGQKSTKLKKAEQYNSMGYTIEIVQEEVIRPYLK